MAPPVLRRCWDLSEDHLVAAAESRAQMADLLKAMTAVAKPASGASKILIAIARIARPSVDWIEGTLRVELTGDEQQTRFAIMEDIGGGVRELVYPRFVVKVPMDEFLRGLRLAPRVVEPLVVKEDVKGKIVLVPKKRGRATLAPPSFEIAEESLKKSMPPAVQKTLGPPKPGGARPSRRATARPDDALFMIEIPRTPKVLDLSELEEGPKLRARKKPR